MRHVSIIGLESEHARDRLITSESESDDESEVHRGREVHQLEPWRTEVEDLDHTKEQEKIPEHNPERADVARFRTALLAVDETDSQEQVPRETIDKRVKTDRV